MDPDRFCCRALHGAARAVPGVEGHGVRQLVQGSRDRGLGTKIFLLMK